MENKKAQELIQKYIEGTATKEEKALLNSWYNHRSHTIKDELPDPDYEYLSKNISKNLPGYSKSFPIWLKYSAAAAIILIAGTGLFYSMHQNRIPVVTETVQKHTISPGKNAATLTLANGKKIKLSDIIDGKVGEEAGINISKARDGQLIYEIKELGSQTNKTNKLSTAKGETYQVRLPDGSSVWLNSASSLIYPLSLSKNSVREVQLIGEAYFEVSKDKKHPFVVKTRQQEVIVLGTHFNISSYPDEQDIQTTLIEGSVKVASSRDKKVLLPGQQSSLSGNVLTVKNVEANDVIAWKDGLFVFKDESLESIMRKIARWYDVEIVYQDANKEKLFWGGVSRYDDVFKVLRKLELTGGVHFEIKGRRIVVTK